jgi:hypothetical protein
MHDLADAVKDAVMRVKELEAKVKELEDDVAFRDGELSELKEQLKAANAERDYYFRWAVETTKTVFDIGIFVNEVINTARGKVGNDLQAVLDPTKTEAILRGVEAEVTKRPMKQAPKLPHPRNLDEAAE